ncbi:MAG: DNA topoisomerase, partial [Nitrospirota bacterium]|nr:DNA topoisomerase [Nitrospirota bacterium]
DAFRVKEDAVITISTDGWIRRVGIIKDLSKARVREGDRVMAILGGSTLEPIVFFSNYGSAYTIRIGDIPPARSGYGDPVQKLFKFKDGERIIGGWSFDPRMRFGASQSDASSSNGDQLALFNKKGKPQTPASLEALAVTTSGMGLRFDLSAVQEPSTRLGRKFCKLKEGEEVLGLEIITGPLKQTVVAVASAKGRALLCKAEEVAQLAGPGRGVIVMKLEPKDTIVGYTLLFSKNDQLVLVKDGGSTLPVSLRKYQVVGRGGKGHALVKRGRLTGMEVAELTIPIFQTE